MGFFEDVEDWFEDWFEDGLLFEGSSFLRMVVFVGCFEDVGRFEDGLFEGSCFVGSSSIFFSAPIVWHRLDLSNR